MTASIAIEIERAQAQGAFGRFPAHSIAKVPPTPPASATDIIVELYRGGAMPFTAPVTWTVTLPGGSDVVEEMGLGDFDGDGLADSFAHESSATLPARAAIG